MLIYCHAVRLSHSKYSKYHNRQLSPGYLKGQLERPGQGFETGDMSQYTGTYGNPKLHQIAAWALKTCKLGPCMGIKETETVTVNHRWRIVSMFTR